MSNFKINRNSKILLSSLLTVFAFIPLSSANNRADAAGNYRPRVAPKAHRSLSATGRTFISPASGTFTSGFGTRWGKMHKGIDIAGPIGTTVKAAKSGRVSYAGWASGYGNLLEIDHGNGLSTRYAHLSKFYASNGQTVSIGQSVAALGNTGQSTGPHLHFEVLINSNQVNPKNYM